MKTNFLIIAIAIGILCGCTKNEVSDQTSLSIISLADSDTTISYIPIESFNSATFDSIVVLGMTVSATGDSAAFSLQVKQTAQDSAYVEVFNALWKAYHNSLSDDDVLIRRIIFYGKSDR